VELRQMARRRFCQRVRPVGCARHIVQHARRQRQAIIRPDAPQRRAGFNRTRNVEMDHRRQQGPPCRSKSSSASRSLNRRELAEALRFWRVTIWGCAVSSARTSATCGSRTGGPSDGLGCRMLSSMTVKRSCPTVCVSALVLASSIEP
jgi:hypothetical protein